MRLSYERRCNRLLYCCSAILCSFFGVAYVSASSLAPECKPSLEQGPEDFDHRVISAFVESGETGMLSAVNGHPKMRSSRLQLAYHLDEGQPFEAKYMIGNYTSETAEYFIVLLVDYQRKRFLLDGVSSDLHLVSVNPMERRIFQMKADPLGKGGHDLVLLAMSKGGLSGTEHPLLYHRANIFVENCALPQNHAHAKDSEEIEVDVPGEENSRSIWKISAENPYTPMEQQPEKMTQIPVRVKILGLDKRTDKEKP